jgi:hypothetical protein
MPNRLPFRESDSRPPDEARDAIPVGSVEPVLAGGRDAPANSRRAAFAARDGGVLLVPADLPQMRQRRVRDPVVAVSLRVASEGMASAVER